MFLTKLNPFSLPSGRRDDAYGLAVIRGFLILSVIIILFVSCTQQSGHFLSILGLSCSIAVSSLMVGGFFGFLFGIPRRLQESRSVANPDNGKYTDNTNLEEISDWLTKIIVGISLTQLPKIYRLFDILCKQLSTAFKDYLLPDFSYSYSGAIVVFFFLCGFLAVYLWARTYLMQSLSGKATAELKRTMLIQDLEYKKKEFQKTATRIQTIENRAEYSNIIQKAAPDEPKVYNDCQKGRWGGKMKDEFYQIKATVSKKDNLNVQSLVKFSIEATRENLDKVKIAYFMLHDSFLPDMIRMVAHKTGETTIEYEFSAYEAFTVGIVLEKTDGTVSKYEVDLNLLENLPDGFQYTDTLPTIEQINTSLSDLS